MRIPEVGTDGAPLPARTRIRLEDPRWRLKRAWWQFPPLLTLGVLCWAGFLWAGVKTAQRKYYVSAGAWLVVSLTWGLVLPALAPQLVAVVAVTSIVAPFMQAVVMHPQYLLERAERDL